MDFSATPKPTPVTKMTKAYTPLSGKGRVAIANKYRVCVGQIVDLACSTLIGDDPFSKAKELIDDILGASGHIHSSLEPLRAALESLNSSDQDDNAVCLNTLRDHGFDGYVIEFQTPAEPQEEIDPIFDYCVLKWIYAETIEQAWSLAIEWAEAEQQRIAKGA